MRRNDMEWDYLIGEMATEVYEAPYQKVKSYIDKWPGKRRIINRKNKNEFWTYICECFDDDNLAPVTCSMFEIYWYQKLQEKDFEFQGNTFNMGYYLSKSYFDFQFEIEQYRKFFKALVYMDRGDHNPEYVEASEEIKDIFWNHHSEQKIDYEIMYNREFSETGFYSVYSINNFLSLLAFEYSHIKETGTVVKTCECCGRFFIPEYRSDTLYCNNPSLINPDRTCREIGAQIAMKSRLEKDNVAAAYRKKYSSLSMAIKRNTGNEDYYKKRRNEFVKEGQNLKELVNQGKLTSEEAIDWIERFN